MADNGSACVGLQDHGKARMMDIDNNPRGDALDCGDRRVVAVATTMMTTMHKQTLALAPMAAATITIAHHPLPKRQRIVGPSSELLRKNSDNFAEGEDRRRHRNDNRRTGREWGGGDKDDKEEEYHGCWRMVGKVASAMAKMRGGCKCIVICAAALQRPRHC